MSTEYLWTVRYKRRGWTWAQSRHFQRRHAALRLLAKLRTGDPDLEPLVELQLERRELGPPEVVEAYRGIPW